MNALNCEKSLLSVNALNIDFQTDRGFAHVVKDVHFSIGFGETFGLVGESGCGKSVTSRALMGLIPSPGKVSSGAIELTPTPDDSSIDLLHCSEKELQRLRGQTIGMIFQEPDMALNPIMRVGDQIAETFLIQEHSHNNQTFIHRWISGLNRHKKQEYLIKSIELLKALDIPRAENVAQQYPHQLSGGMKQRILIAIALAGTPSLLISDESTSSLDVSIQSQIIVLLDQLKKEQRIQSVLFITHDLGLAAMCCTRLAVMYAGTMCEIGPVPDIFNHPKHPYTRALLETIPRKTRETNLKPISGQVPDLVDAPDGCRFHPRCTQKMKKCEQEMPMMISEGEGHQMACWLYDSQCP
jgi:peptide/nickel transport system ATP-binding protein